MRTSALQHIKFYLKISRPGLWFPTIWLYMLPFGGQQFWVEPLFWLGLLYVTFPLNFLIYGWNDIVDYETDQLNPRKDSFLFGAKGTKEQLAQLPQAITKVQLFFCLIFIALEGWEMVTLFAVLGGILVAYNFPQKGLRNIPGLDLAAQFGYLMVVPFSIMVNDLMDLRWLTYFYLLLFAVQSQLIGEVMDITPDRKAGRTTTATTLGMRATKVLIIIIVATETTLLFFAYGDYIFGSMLGLGLIWLVLDLTLIYKTKRYTLEQMQLFGVGSNVIALVSMAYVWWSGCLL